MDKSDLGSIWAAVLGELEISLSQANYKTWLKNTSLASVDGISAVVLVPNIFTKNWVSKKYHTQILAALRKTIPGVSAVEYQIGASNEKAPDEVKLTAPERPSETPAAAKPVSEKLAPPQTSAHHYEKYKFQNFVVGSGNQLAFAASKLVSEKPGEHYNPLFLYGPAGVGKTHLMWAIISGITSKNSNLNTLYVTSEDFISSFISTVSKGGTFTDKYRRVDVLLIDDIQFIAGKERTQEEFFHTFNALHQANKQIVICSDRPPKSIATLEDRLRSRFEWGMVADIQPPDLETRAAILTNKAASKNIELDVEIANFIATSIESNIRELEGALNRVVAFSQLQGLPITLELAQQVLGSSKPSSRRNITPKLIIEQTAIFYDVKSSDIVGSKRDKQIAMPRQIAMYIMREELGMSFPQIAYSLGKRDHTTVMHGVKKIQKLTVTGEPVGEEIKTLRQKIFTS